MAFVGAPGGVVSRQSQFCGGSVSQQQYRRPTSARGPSMMADLTDLEKRSFAKIGEGSKWRESVFIGGFPGGEEAYLNWVESGAKENVPDLPDYLQPKPASDKPEPPRQSGLTELEKKSFAKIGEGSQWRESVFIGGFPGGEEAYLKWVDGGTKENVPDLPDYLQPNSKPKSKSFMGMVSNLFGGSGNAGNEASEGGGGDGEGGADVGDGIGADEMTALGEPVPIVDNDPVPPASLYEQYYPEATRNLAPFISMVSAGDFYKDRVSMYMGEVTASAVDLHYPKETKNKAPIISISYNGNLATASVSVSMAEIDPLPTIPPPVSKGETVTKLVTGPGGGLKLEFEAEGMGPVNVYSDPRAIEKFNSMTQKS